MLLNLTYTKLYKQNHHFFTMTKDNNSDQGTGIPEMEVNGKYSNEKPLVPQNTEKIQKEMEKTKKELDKLKNWVIKKYSFTQAISILPPQATEIFIEEEDIPKQTEKYIQLYMIIPEAKFKEIPNMTKEIIKEIDKIKGQKIWLQIKTPIDIFENCYDGKYDIAGAIAMSYPLHDTGLLGALRVMEIHKSLVLRKFEKYVVSYVIGGSFIRGEAKPTSDLDVIVIINDTDVKKMPRLELKERLRNMIAGKYMQEAVALAGVKNSIHVQTYLLTEFWESVKDAHPVMFTFIRDGIPIYDRGTFMPWKALLKMGKLKPSPEAIDMFMKTADKTKEMIERRLLDAMIDVYYGVLNPSQALLMLYGLPPPTHKETFKLMDEIFVKKEKLLKKTDIAVLEKGVKLFKAYEHDSKYKISGKEIDKLVKDSEIYMKKLKELGKQIEKRAQEKTIEQFYKDIFELLKSITSQKSQDAMIKSFEKDFVKKGKFTNRHLKILNDVVSARAEFKKGKLNAHKVDDARKNAGILINALIEFSQRCELATINKGKMTIKHKKGIAELATYGGETFLFQDNIIKKITNKVEEINMEEVKKAFENQKQQKETQINSEVFTLLKKELGDFEVIL